MDIYGDVNLNSNLLSNFLLPTETDFPAIPKAGRMLFKNKKLYFCVEVANGLPVWIPLSGEINMYVHSQSTPSDSWVINHGLGIATVMIQVLDEQNHQIVPDYVACDEQNAAHVTFSTPQTGKAIVVAGSLSGSPKAPIAYTQEFTNSTTWVVNHGLGYNPEISVFIGGNMVQPLSIVHNSLVQATVTFTAPQSGYVRCA
jgi:hypothetical protein